MNPTRDGSASTAAQRLALFAAELDLAAAPAPVCDAIGLHALDALGCGLAAIGTAAAPYAPAHAAAAAADGPATALGVARGVAPDAAALANGISCHALDFDDTHPASIAHVSSVVVPAALSAAEAAGATGRELATALLAGNEITTRVGRVAGDAFHLRGFHPTAICGVFGATAAVGRLSGLDADRIAQALGIAGSMASGLMAYLTDGSETKRIHPGWMAHAAHVAVSLAAYGATGPAAVLEGRNGVYAAFIDRHGVTPDEVTADLGVAWETPAIAFKPYPACHFVHAPLDALVELQAEHGFDAGAIERITVLLPQAGLELVGDPIERKRRPATPYESRFSAPFAIAAWLHVGAVDATTFADPLLSDSAVHALADKVDCARRHYETFPRSLPGGVRVSLRGRAELERHVLHQRGGAASPMEADAIVAKFRANAQTALPAAETGELERMLLALPDQDDLAAVAAMRAACVRA